MIRTTEKHENNIDWMIMKVWREKKNFSEMSIKQYVKQLTGGAIVDLRFTFQTLLQGKKQ